MRQEKRNENDWNLFICPSAFCLFLSRLLVRPLFTRLLLILILSFFLPQIYCFCSVCLPSLFFWENLYLLLAAGSVDPLAGCLLSMESPPRAGFLNAKSFARPAARVNVQHACIYAVRTAVYSTSTAAAVCVWNVTLFTSAVLQSISLLFPPADILTV